MLFFRNIQIALRALKTNKLRSFLTMLGIIIGVFAVITLLAMGEGFKKDVSSEIEAVGSNILVVLPGKVMAQKAEMGKIAGLAGISTLTLDDKKAIKEKIDSLEK